ncbi:NADH-quinone oxidoreductase subunit NuoG [Candidatus Tachikawaea gelatinosa]|nr:NADH-quinone oxidoreductase subunit NuoG [Candidatus Tachikawaea gelatinosa]
MIIIHIDGKKYTIKKTNNLLNTCLSLGIDIPYFCWHPALGSLGACRLCAIKVYQNKEDKIGKIAMSCMTSAVDNMHISIENAEIKKFRKNIIELMMINHPHDCPVCEEGGSCHLQDMTVMTGHNYRRYRFKKRTFYNQNLGPFISHEMNRCITCYRCVRFYQNYADGKDFGVYGVHNNIYFGRFSNGTLNNEFSGNLIDVCPTGVFTDKLQSKNYTRKWDIQFSPSICQQCCVGCNISVGESNGKIIRIDNRYNEAINYYFICDRGRFGYGYVNRKDRPRYPYVKNNDDFIRINTNESIMLAVDIIKSSKNIIGIGSPRASIESNFALQNFVGKKNFYTGISFLEQQKLNLIIKILREGGFYIPSVHEIESYDAILILGEDITQIAARIALSIRQAVKEKMYNLSALKGIEKWQSEAILNYAKNKKYPLFITSVDKTSLDDISMFNYYAPINDQARFGFSIAHFINNDAPKVDNLSVDIEKKTKEIAKILNESKKPLIISGSNSGNLSLIECSANIAKSLKKNKKDVGIVLLVPEVNSIGVGLIEGNPLEKIHNQLKEEHNNVIIILENDICRSLSKNKRDLIFKKNNKIIVLDHQLTKTTKKAKLLLSSTSFVESDGTLINYEGRAQRFFKTYDHNYYNNNDTILFESWRWINYISMKINNKSVQWKNLDDIIKCIEKSVVNLKGIKKASPKSTFRIHGQKIARLTNRSSGRTAINAKNNVHETRQPQDKDTIFTFSMEGNSQPNHLNSEIPFVWSPGWNSVQALNKFQKEVGRQLLAGNPGHLLFRFIKNNSLKWFDHIPSTFIKNENSWIVVPYYQLFGSEELSQLSKDFQKRIPTAQITMNPMDVYNLGLDKGGNFAFLYDEEKWIFPISFSKILNPGQVGLPIGMSGVPIFLLGANIKQLKEIR